MSAVAVAAVVWGVVVATGGHRPAASGTPTYLEGETYGGPAVMATFNPASGRLGPVLDNYVDAIAPGGRMGISLDANRNRVVLVNLRTGRSGRPIKVGQAPDAVAFTADGKTAYVVNVGIAAYQGGAAPPKGEHVTDTVTPVNLVTGRADRPLKVCRNPFTAAYSAPTHLLVVGCRSEVVLVDTTDGRLVRTFPLGSAILDSIGLSWSGTTAVIGQAGNGHGSVTPGWVVPINLRTRTAGRPLDVGGDTDFGGPLPELAPGDNRDVDVTIGRSLDGPNMVVRVDLATGTVSAPLRLGGDLVNAVHFWSGGQAGYVALDAPEGRGSRWRVATSPGSAGRLVDLALASSIGEVFPFSFAGQSPYLIIPQNKRQATVVNLAKGTVRIRKLPMFPDSPLTYGQPGGEGGFPPSPLSDGG